MSDSRLEKFIYAICSMDVTDLPVPLSRIEKLWNCLITGETPDFEPSSRNEKYLMAMLDRYDISNLPAPMSRGEKLLYKIAVGETDLSDVPGYLSRYEELLKYLIENGGISGGDFEYVLHTLNQSLYTLYTTAEKPVKKAIIYGDTLANTLQESSSLAVTPMGEDIDAQQATITGTANGTIKSAILKGNTINCLLSVNNTPNGAVYNYSRQLEVGETYTIFYNYVVTGDDMNIVVGEAMVGTSSTSIPNTAVINGRVNAGTYIGKKVVTLSNVSSKMLTNWIRSGTGTLTVNELYCIQGDYSNIDIPFVHTGLQSVKLPVLTTTGKNLFDGKIKRGVPNSDSGWQEYIQSENFIRVNSIDFILSINLEYITNSEFVRIYCYDENKNFISTKAIIEEKPLNTKYIKFSAKTKNNPSDLSLPYNVQIEYGTVPTTYEPYKSNILSTPSDLELRKVGDVEDEMDCSTGEVIERVGEMVLNGSENWTKQPDSNWHTDTHISFRFNATRIIAPNIRNSGKINCISDKFKSIALNGTSYKTSDEFIGTDGGKSAVYFNIKILKSRLNGDETVDGFKQWIAQNPIILQYEREKESTKTINLTIQDQDGNTVPHLQAFNETTHISTSSTGLIPNVVIPATVSYPSIIKPSTLYTVKLKRSVTSESLMINVGGTEQAVTSDCFTLTTPATLASQDVIFSGKGNVISEVTVVEGDQTAKEYGYFEGMESVKMPCVTISNSLFNGDNSMEIGAWDGIGDPVPARDEIRSKNNFISFTNELKDGDILYLILTDTTINCDTNMHVYDENKSKIATLGYEHGREYIEGTDFINGVATITVHDASKCKYFSFRAKSTNTNCKFILINQSITLSTPSDLELRGIGSGSNRVEDELDAKTGEMTERVGEIVLDETLSYEHAWDGARDTETDYIIGVKVNNPLWSVYDELGDSLFKCDKLRTRGITSFKSSLNVGYFLFYVNKSVLGNGLTNEKIREYMLSLNATVQYPLEIESIKPIDISTVDQDNQPTQLGTFENITHVSLEAENLIPEVEMEVATRISKELASASPLMDDISTNQQQLESTVDEQSNNVDATMIATTEIYEETL